MAGTRKEDVEKTETELESIVLPVLYLRLQL